MSGLEALFNAGDVQRIKAVVEQHSSTGASIGLAEIIPLTSSWIFDRDVQDAIARNSATELESIAEGIRMATAAMSKLHPQVRRVLEHGFASSASEDSEIRFFTPDGSPFVCYDQVSLLLSYLDCGLNDASESSPLDNAARVAALLPKVSGKADSKDTWAKVKLVSNARQLWPTMTGKSAPKNPSPGTPFFEFVGDLIDAMELDWDPESTFKANKNMQKLNPK